jgi:hypothetical protein
MNRTTLICTVLVALGLAAIVGEFCYLHSRQKEREVRLTREQAERDEADALLEKALSALRRRDAAGGLRLLAEYLDLEQATQKERALQLVEDVQRATSGERSAAFLRRLSEAQLARLEAGGDPPSRGEEVTEALAKPLYLDTLRAGVPGERQRREELRRAEQAEVQRRIREQQQRETRVRASVPYKQMVALADDLRKRYHEARGRLQRQKRALERLFRELVLNEEEQARLRKELDESKKKAQALKRTFAERRAPARAAFQAEEGVAVADLEVFDRLLDRLAEKLLASLET